MSEWREAAASELKKDDVFKFDENDHPHKIVARWDENGEAKFLSHDASTDRTDGLSCLRPDTPVLIRD